jgi:hypothetical protein
MTFHDATTAAAMGYCNKTATCQQCPYCLVALSIQTSTASAGDAAATAANNGNNNNRKLDCYYRCGFCDWTSKECGLSVQLDGGSVPGRVELMRAAEDLGAALSARRSELQQPAQALHGYTSKIWNDRAEPTRRRMGSSSAGTSRTMHKQQSHSSKETWSVERLEHKLRETKASWEETIDFALPDVDGVKRISIQDILKEENESKDADGESAATSLFSNLLQGQRNTDSVAAHPPLPVPIPLSLRKSRRCRAELAQGRPGILLKPKLNPLDGDSSLPTGHGQWYRKVRMNRRLLFIEMFLNQLIIACSNSFHLWILFSSMVQDSSAIHVIPRITIVQVHRTKGQSDRSNNFAVLLNVSNPTLGKMRLRLKSSNYQGEVNYWRDEDEQDFELTVTTRLTGLLLDTLRQTHVDVDLKPDLTNALGATETVELLSAEDSIIELGSKAGNLPEAVRKWNPNDFLSSATVTSSKLQLVAKSASDAWFELFCISSVFDDTSSFGTFAFPIALQVDLGHGSWDSSLIPPNEEGSKDSVTIDFVLILMT